MASKSLYNLYEDLMIKFEKQEQLLKDNNNLIKTLNETIMSLQETKNNLKDENNNLKLEILRLKANNDKDSYNSSSKNGFKKGIINRREKSNKRKELRYHISYIL